MARPKTIQRSPGEEATARLARSHLRFGWWALLLFLALGAALEVMHAFKSPIYLDAGNETRRLLWTLGHAHGTLLAIVNILFGLSLPHLTQVNQRARRLGSVCLLGAAVLLPLGFLLGGTVIYSGDPGPGILLVPAGALLLAVGVGLAARSAGRSTRRPGDGAIDDANAPPRPAREGRDRR